MSSVKEVESLDSRYSAPTIFGSTPKHSPQSFVYDYAIVSQNQNSYVVFWVDLAERQEFIRHFRLS